MIFQGGGGVRTPCHPLWIRTWDWLILETASPRTHKPQIVNESLIYCLHSGHQKLIKKSIVSKWQQRWDIFESDRFLHTFKPLVDSKPYLDLPSKDLFPTILQLRTGYYSLNEYSFKLNQCESSECACGEIEAWQHFILECPLYEDNRQTPEEPFPST